ncbi:TniQ family protein [Nocardiopsis alba]|uniref:TniQ family protein n=1 Tax=Nocardiopsis alba TaxID=53437 RepID=UPI00362D28E2
MNYPFTTPPVAAETTASYIARLAEENGMDEYLVLSHIAHVGYLHPIRQRGWNRHDFALNPLAAQRLAAVSGYPLDTLRRTLSFRHLLVSPQSPRDIPIAQHHLLKKVLRPPWDVAAACPKCSAARGLTTRPQILLDQNRLVCLRHGFWLADQPDGRPLELERCPELQAAVRRFRRLRRKDPERTGKAFSAAQQIWSKYRYGANPHTMDIVERIWDRRSDSWSRSPRHPSLTLRYPEIVALTDMICSPYWVKAAAQPFIQRSSYHPRNARKRPDQMDFLLELGRRMGHPSPEFFSHKASSVSAWLSTIRRASGHEKEQIDWRTLVRAAPR